MGQCTLVGGDAAQGTGVACVKGQTSDLRSGSQQFSVCFDYRIIVNSFSISPFGSPLNEKWPSFP